MGYYPRAEELLANTEGHLLELKRSPRSMLGFFAWALFSALIVSVICYFFGSVRISYEIPVVNLLSTYWFFLFPIGVAIEGIRQYHDDLYILDREKVTHKGGRLSLEYSVPEIRYQDIRAVGVSQSFVGRLFDYGDVELNTAAQDQGELLLEGIRAPDELAELIEEIRAFLIRHSRD
ncbi:MAG: PH domain-containing protein [Bdellovibrionales bacterium]|nr:PH domain-containing protein [Bdellovibrionales bacterium]